MTNGGEVVTFSMLTWIQGWNENLPNFCCQMCIVGDSKAV
jgi:hypothetical protein